MTNDGSVKNWSCFQKKNIQKFNVCLEKSGCSPGLMLKKNILNDLNEKQPDVQEFEYTTK